MTLRLVIGHKRPEFPVWDGWHYATWEPLQDSDFRIESGVSDKLPSSLASEYRYLFAIARQLRRREYRNNSLITIAHYRRLVLNKSLGRRSINQPWTHILNSAEASELHASDLTRSLQSDYLVTRPVKLACVMNQYHANHHLRDLLRFLSDSIDAYAIEEIDALRTLGSELLIPAPTAGTFPITIFLDIMQTLERSALAYVQSGLIKRSGYQERCLGFCLERLHSYLLLKTLEISDINLSFALGHQVTIAQSLEVKPTIE